MGQMHGHKQSKVILSRLKRAHGHLAKVIEMIEAESDCLSVAQQLRAVESALFGAKQTYIHDHIEHCLADSNDARKFSSKMKEFKEISKYL